VSAALAAAAASPVADLAVESVCAHCGDDVAAGAGPFCCAGCAAAHRLVEEMGLERYYRGRRLDPALRLPRPPEEPAPDLAAYAHAQADGTAALDLLVEGLHCAACVWLIETVLKRDPVVVDARVNLTSRRLRLVWRGAPEEGTRLAELVRRLGYRAVPYAAEPALDVATREERALLRALAVAGFAAANVMLLSVSVWAGIAGEMGEATRSFLHWVSALIALPAVAYAGQPFFRSAWRAVSRGRTNMDVPISLGVVLATAMSLYETMQSGRDTYFDSAVMLLLFLLIGRYLDQQARGRARSAAGQLLALMASPATVLDRDRTPRRVPAGAVQAGDIVLVAAGERITVDGRVEHGHSTVDKSMIDGESLPAEIGPGGSVLAGMLNLAEPIEVAVSATGERTFAADIVRLMEAAEHGRARLVLLADRVGRLYAPFVHLLAVLTFATWAFFASWHTALLNAVAVLIITCPCALGLAVPAVQVIAGGRLMRRGILLKSATALERLAQVDTVVFDKTGTLTLGRLELRDAPEGALHIAAGLAAGSRHPLCQALHRACPDAPALPGIEEHAGAGLSRRDPAREPPLLRRPRRA
jgi:P-type Cu2+ transporter